LPLTAVFDTNILKFLRVEQRLEIGAAVHHAHDAHPRFRDAIKDEVFAGGKAAGTVSGTLFFSEWGRIWSWDACGEWMWAEWFTTDGTGPIFVPDYSKPRRIIKIFSPWWRRA
jgi:hypothetical protein